MRSTDDDGMKLLLSIETLKALPIFIGFLTLASCQASLMGSAKPLSADALSEEYERSSTEVRRKYATMAATMPTTGEDKGSVFLAEKDLQTQHQLTCWFTRDQVMEFSKVKGGQYLTVKGVFSGEAGLDLRFCKLVQIEAHRMFTGGESHSDAFLGQGV